jgi:hypothetical protein
VQGSIDLEKNFLGQILRFIEPAVESIGKIVDALLMTPHHGLPGGHVSIPAFRE